MGILNSEINIKGIGQKRKQILADMGIHTLGDMLYYLPRDYIDLSCPKPIAEASNGEFIVFKGMVEKTPTVSYPKRGLNITKAYVKDPTGRVQCTWFNQPFIRNNLCEGKSYIFCAVMHKKFNYILNPRYFPDDKTTPGVLPVYRLGANMPMKVFRDAMRACLDKIEGSDIENLPKWLREQHHLCDLRFALENIHFPAQDTFSLAKRRLIFDEILYYQLFALSNYNLRKKGKPIDVDKAGFEKSLSCLPFKLTNAQLHAIEDVISDIGKEVAMNRLVQGDVGSGKTMVAFYAMLFAVKSGHQAAIMAPTEVLSMQHYNSAKSFFGPEYNVVLLKGGMSASQKEAALQEIKQGKADVVVGTHAIIQDSVVFRDLAMVVTDEQHRFGVAQRAALMNKSSNPHILIMSATPIPRTLAFILYGGLEVSLIDELPPGRKKIKTSFVPASKKMGMFRYIKEQIKLGRQAYIVTPLVEASEELDISSAQELYKELKAGIFSDIRIGILHGRMKSDEKQQAIEKFAAKDIDVLVATTVIEVGIDVENANVMVIMDAERFGLSQLHQLRGRVGRGEHESYCFILSDSNGKEAKQRFEIFVNNADGFRIAEKDLQLRGPGQFLGDRQHGAGWFKIANFTEDIDILYEAREAADKILKDNENEKNMLLGKVNQVYSKLTKNIAFN